MRECICGRRWRDGGGGGGVSVLGSLRVSQVLSGRESGRYLIVIASMERTEAGPVRKFLIYLVFLFSLPPPPPSFAPSFFEGRRVKGEVCAWWWWWWKGGGSLCGAQGPNEKGDEILG